MKRIKKISAGNGRTRVEVEIFEVGSDLLAIIGGEGSHIGAATLAERVLDGIHSSTMCAPGHREAELTRQFSDAVASATGRRTLTIAGIHLDRITGSEIEAIRRNTRELVALAVPEEVPSRES